MRRPFRILLVIAAVFAAWSAWNYAEARRLERAMASLQQVPANSPVGLAVSFNDGHPALLWTLHEAAAQAL